MPLFRCEQCGCMENTACCNYWPRKSAGRALLCSECDPDIGEWHCQFVKRTAEDMLIDNEGHLWNRLTVEQGKLPSYLRIVGEVPVTQAGRDEAHKRLLNCV